LPQRIKAHAAICFMALILYRVMRAKLRAADTKLSPERALPSSTANPDFSRFRLSGLNKIKNLQLMF
jgi:transposase